MANKQLFSNNNVGKMVRPTDTVNNAGGKAYSFSDEHKLAQYIFTGCMTDTYYVSAKTQLDSIIELCKKLDPEYVAKAALAARKDGKMKDTAALLVAMLTVMTPGDLTLFYAVFDKVIDNGKMLRNFCQIIRSGKVGRKSFGTGVRNAIRRMLDEKGAEWIFRVSGNDPSITDIIRMVRPRPTVLYKTGRYINEFDAVYKYLLKGEVDTENLPKNIVDFEIFKKDGGELPKVPPEKLTALPLTAANWKAIALQANWQYTRMNLNSFAKHGVFNLVGKLGSDDELITTIANRIKDPQQVKTNSVFPYQMLTTYQSLSPDVPTEIQLAVQDALEISLDNVPTYHDYDVYVCVDISGSMENPVTGYKGSATTATKCVDIGALVASAIKKSNPNAKIILFNYKAKLVNLNSRDSLATNTKFISSQLGGGTDTTSAFNLIANDTCGTKKPLLIFISDNESWIDNRGGCNRWGVTPSAHVWETYRSKHQGAKLVCVDITPNESTQVYDSEHVLNVGGFSDSVFAAIYRFVTDGKKDFSFVDTIKEIVL